MSPLSLHIDTDPGVDDLLALAVCLASPEVRVVGITTVAGNVGIETVTENALRFLALADRRIPVGRGAAEPLRASPVHAGHVHGPDGRLGVALPPATTEPLGADEVFRRSLGNEHCATVLALGPLTNVATLLDRAPELLEEAEIVWMGGSLSGGNVTPAAEFNCYADPDAVERVLASGVALRIIGLDATHQVLLQTSDLAPDPFGELPRGRFLAELLDRYGKTSSKTEGLPGVPLNDPCAAIVLIAPELFRFETRSLSVGVDAGDERGRLTAGPREAGRRAGYAVEVDGRAVATLCLERLGAWAREAA